jgi:hypothetical protein
MSTPTYAPETSAPEALAPEIHIPDGTDLLVQELREEFAHLVRHPIEELKRLEHVAADGDSPTTPLLTVMGAAILVGTIFALVLGLTLLVVSLTT